MNSVTDIKVVTSTCRSCTGYCPINVTLEDGRVTKVEGNWDAPLYNGFICPKGRGLPRLHDRPDRLLTSLKKQPDGSFAPISSDALVDEISEKLGVILEKFGPRSVAAYLGGGVADQPAASSMMVAFLEAIGSPMLFSAATIDQPGVMIAQALHGTWMGGRQRTEKWDVFMIVGGNPIISKQYVPQNPGNQIKTMRRNGAKIIVIDPRRTETARHADVYLQPYPGEDPTILAGILHLIIANNGVNRAFVDLNAEGLDTLAIAVKPFTPEYVAARAGIEEKDLRAAAQLLIDANGGEIGLGTGPSMATRGTLSSYLGLCLHTLKGFWGAEGDDAVMPHVLLPRQEFRAQPSAPTPAWGFGEKMRVRDLEQTVAGMPTAALPEEILTPGEGQVRALFLHAGVMQTWPQQSRTIEALQSLDLLITHDIQMSPTSHMADYVIATKLPFEVSSMTLFNEITGNYVHPGYGYADPYAAYQPAVVSPPADADLLDSWTIYYRVAKRLGIKLRRSGFFSQATEKPLMDMENEPSTEDIYEMMCAGSAIPLSEVGQYPNGHVFEKARETVKMREPGCEARLQLADPHMIEELGIVAAEAPLDRRRISAEFPFQLIPSRMQNAQNAVPRLDGLIKWGYNPAFMNPVDLESLNLQPGSQVHIRSNHGQVVAFVEVDAGLRPGVIALMHGFGGLPGPNYDPRRDGANVNQLTNWEDDNDRRSGMPRLGGIPVAVVPAESPRPEMASQPLSERDMNTPNMEVPYLREPASVA